MKIKEKIVNWIFKDEITKMKNDIDLHNKQMEDEIAKFKKTVMAHNKYLTNAETTLIKSTEAIEKCRKTMNSICDVGVDVNLRGQYENWAVICVHGRTEFVKFVQFSQRDIYEIIGFLKQFEYSNKRIDAPHPESHFID